MACLAVRAAAKHCWGNNVEDAALRERLDKTRTALLNERNKSWTAPWKELRDYIEPSSGRFDDEMANDGSRKDQKIINDCATSAAAVLEAGMQSGMTSPASPWFKLGVPDPSLNEYAPVKNWLYQVQKVMSALFVKSNLYNALPTCYGEQGVFGTGVMAGVPDQQNVIRFFNFTVGSYMLATSDRQIVDVMYRDFSMTARQMVQQFGLANVSATVRQMYDQGSADWIKVCHAIEPNDGRDASRRDNQNMAYRSAYWEQAGDSRKLLGRSGFNKFPVMAPRWKVKGESVYGKGPGSVAIGEIKALQRMEMRKAEFIEKGVRPPMGAPVNMRGQRLSILPGDVNYITDSQFGTKFAPLYEVRPEWVNQLRGEIGASEQSINEAFFVDLFLLISQSEGTMTAYEVAQRKEEKMLMLGPVLERQNDELLDPLIEFTFDQILAQSAPRWAGLLPGNPLIPPPPKEMQGMDLQVEYTSILAQAQKALGVASIERAVSFTGNLAEAFPEAADLLNVDGTVREYFDAIGVPPTILRDPEAVDALRQQRAEAQQQAAQQEQLGQIAQGAKLLSETDMASDNALTQLLNPA